MNLNASVHVQGRLSFQGLDVSVFGDGCISWKHMATEDKDKTSISYHLWPISFALILDKVESTAGSM